MKMGSPLYDHLDSSEHPNHSKPSKPPRHVSKMRHCLSTAKLGASTEQEQSGFVPVFRSGSCGEIGPKQNMEDEHICIDHLFPCRGSLPSDCPSQGAFYGVFDGHGGTQAASFVRKNILKNIVEDECFPNLMEAALKRAFVRTDHAFADSCALDCWSGTTALTAIILGRSLLSAYCLE